MNKYIGFLILSIALPQYVFAVERYECISEKIGVFSLEIEEKGFQTLKIYNRDKSIQSVRTNSNAYIGFLKQQGSFNLQVDHHGEVDWSQLKSRNQCYAYPSARGFWATSNNVVVEGNKEIIRGSLGLRPNPLVNPRAKIKYYPAYYPAWMHTRNEPKSVRLDGRICPHFGSFGEYRSYFFKCVRMLENTPVLHHK